MFRRALLTVLALSMITCISCEPKSTYQSEYTEDIHTEHQTEQTDTIDDTEYNTGIDIEIDTNTGTPSEDIQTEADISDEVQESEDNKNGETAGETPSEDIPDVTEPTEDTENVTDVITTRPDETSPGTTQKPSDTTSAKEETKAPETKPKDTTAKPTETTKPEETTAPHTHTYSTWKIAKAPTCTASGTEQRTCACGDKQTRTVTAKGHTEQAVKGKASTCTAEGLTDGKKCTVCGVFTVKQNTIAKKAHNYKTTKEPNTDPYSPDFAKDGEKKCIACGDTQAVKMSLPAVDSKEYARLLSKRMLYYINEYRVSEGAPKAQMLPNMTEYAEYRAVQLSTNFAHDGNDEGAAATALKYGEYYEFEESYLDLETMEIIYTGKILTGYVAKCGEAIMKGGFSQTSGKYDVRYIDTQAKGCAESYYNSKGHWSYIGRAENIYISIGVYIVGNMKYNCVCTSTTDIYG